MTTENFKTEQELLERYACLSWEKQQRFADVIGGQDWNADMRAESIRFGPELSFRMQVLGTFAHEPQNWLWAWANTQSGLSENILGQALQLKAYGEAKGIDLLRLDSFDFSKDELHLIGLIASGMFGCSGYYMADYGQGTMLLTVTDERIDAKNDNSHLAILTTFPQVIAQYGMNHKRALRYYLQDKGYAVTEEGNSMMGMRNGQTINAAFDELSRLTSLKG